MACEFAQPAKDRCDVAGGNHFGEVPLAKALLADVKREKASKVVERRVGDCFWIEEPLGIRLPCCPIELDDQVALVDRRHQALSLRRVGGIRHLELAVRLRTAEPFGGLRLDAQQRGKQCNHGF